MEQVEPARAVQGCDVFDPPTHPFYLEPKDIAICTPHPIITNSGWGNINGSMHPLFPPAPCCPSPSAPRLSLILHMLPLRRYHHHPTGEVQRLTLSTRDLSSPACTLLPITQSYSPYTRCPSGAAIITKAGEVHSGGYIESAAYNPSLSPFHSAAIAAFAGGMESFEEVSYHYVLHHNSRV